MDNEKDGMDYNQSSVLDDTELWGTAIQSNLIKLEK